MTKIGIISLGCPRNLVDSEVMMGLLKDKGHTIIDEVAKSDIAIVNTCAFIKDAVDESIETILELISLKEKGKIQSIVVAGCLPQRYRQKLKNELSEIDAFVGTGDIPQINTIIKDVLKNKKSFVVTEDPEFIYDDKQKRDLITPPHYVYIKIQEGCANRCSYCLIPEIRGYFRSRPIESILREVKNLSRARSISELNIIGQDTTFYGYDLYKKRRIADLLRSLSRLNKTHWIRLIYTHPAHYDDDLIEVLKKEDSICKYLDLPIQHISDKVLKDMNRKTTARSIRSLIEKLRSNIPNLAIRTTVLIGFPGETDSDFKELINFLKEIRFERLGAFMYSNEEGSRSFHCKNQISEKIKKERLDEVMRLQQKISRDYNKSFLNRRIEVLIDEKSKDKNVYIGRTQFDAPSVDGQVFVKGENLKAGSFVEVKIRDTLEYDLVGETI